MKQKTINFLYNSLYLWIKNNDDLAQVTMFEYVNNVVQNIQYLIVQIKSENIDSYLISYNKIFVSDDVAKIDYRVNYSTKIIKFIILLK